MNKIVIGEAVRTAWRFWRGNTRAAAGALGLATAGFVLSDWGKASGEPPLQLFGILANLSGSLMGAGALFRMDLADLHPGDPAFRAGPGGFQWGRQELRLLGTGLLVLAALVAPMLVIGGGGFALSRGLGGADAHPTAAATVVETLSTALGFCLGVYLAARLALGPAASVAAKRFTTGWALTRGRVWPILGAYLATLGPVILVYVALGATLSLIAPAQASLAMLAGIILVIGILVTFVQLPLAVGVLAHLYRKATAEPVR